METYLGENYTIEKIANAIFDIQKSLCGVKPEPIYKEVLKNGFLHKYLIQEEKESNTGEFKNDLVIEVKGELIIQVNSNQSGLKIEGSLDNQEFFLIQIQNCASGSFTPGTIASEIKGIFKITTMVPFVKITGNDCTGVYYCISK